MDSSTAFLVGPHITSLLRKPLPFSPGGRTMEDVLDTVMGSYIKTGWRFWNKWKGRNEHEADEIAKEVLGELEEKRSWRDASHALKNHLGEMKDRAVVLKADPWEATQDLKNRLVGMKDRVVTLKAEPSEATQALKNRLMDMKNRIVTLKDGSWESMSTKNMNADQSREWRDRVAERLPGFDEVIAHKSGALKAMTDAAAAYLVVRASAPLRLALNLFLTPKVARLLVRSWG